MPSKKVKKKSKDNVDVNVDLLTKKIDQLGQQLDILQIDVKDMAVELIKVSQEHGEKQSLLNRIKARLGL